MVSNLHTWEPKVASRKPPLILAEQQNIEKSNKKPKRNAESVKNYTAPNNTRTHTHKQFYMYAMYSASCNPKLHRNCERAHNTTTRRTRFQERAKKKTTTTAFGDHEIVYYTF